MTTFLGIDVGLNKTGIARAISSFAEPLLVIRHPSLENLVKQIGELAEREGAEQIIMGLPEGKLAPYAKKIGDALRSKGFNVVFWDETLSTKDAIRLSIEAGVPRKKRKELEDAFAAAVMLQSYIDAHRV